MAYLEKYYISYCDDFNTPRRVSILQRDYLGSQNVLSDSTDIEGSSWVNTGLEITGDRIVATNSNSPHWLTQTILKESSETNYRYKAEVKASEYSRVYCRVSGSSGYVIFYFNINTQTFYNTTENGGYTINSNSYTNQGGGVYEIDVNITVGDDTSLDYVIGIVNDSDDYIFAGDNLNGNNISGLEVSNLELFYGQDATELLADVNPVSISYESSEDFKFSPIRPSTAEVFMIFGGDDGVDFEEFWTADEKEFMVQDIKDGTVEWSGYVVVNGFQYDLKGGLYYASIVAADGLASLKSLPFIDDNQKPYGNQDLVYNNQFEFPFSLILTEILKKLELDLDLWTCVDSYEQSMTKTGDTRYADPLSAAYVNVKTYIKETDNNRVPYWYGSGEEWNCEEVLENILHIFGAKLYQEFGVWRVKTINSDVDFGTGDTQIYWRKYDTAGTYLFDYEVVNDEVNIPCGVEDKLMVNTNHQISMADVYKSFRMNYEYTFLREGDTPLNLLPNGNFCDFVNDSVLAAPTGWLRWRRSNKWYIRIKDVTIPFEDAGGNTCGIEIGTHKTGIPTSQGAIRTDPNPAIWTSLQVDDLIYVNKGDKVFFDIWEKYRYYSPDETVQYAPVYRMVFYSVQGKKYYLRNNYKDGVFKYTWEDTDDDFTVINRNGGFSPSKDYNDTYFFTTRPTDRDSWSTYSWHEQKFELETPPDAGWIEFNIHGLAASSGRNSDNFPAFKSWTTSNRRGSVSTSYTFSDKWRVVRENWEDQGGDIPRLQLTGVSIGIIPEESELPDTFDYIYENQNPRYNLQVDPIDIYNGDVQDEKHISNIIVPTNTGGGKNFWDDLGDTYGASSLGLLTVREIMRQYAKPYKILEGTVKIQDARFGSVYTFDIVPNARFILQRGSFNKQKQYIEDATFIEITSDELPDGGTEGNNTLEPEWTPTGNSYCQINDNSLNTGYVIVEERDINLNSPTYDELREVVSDSQNLTQCPLNTPRKYYWGTDDVHLNVDLLSFSPFTEVSNKEIEISLFNDEGNYPYFLHLKSLGSVERIYTLTSPNNVISDWVYLNDVIINGYIYRVLRTDYKMTAFNGFTHNFNFA